MILLKSVASDIKNTKLFAQTTSGFQYNFDNLFDEKDFVYFIEQDSDIIGFLKIREAEYTNFIRIFVSTKYPEFNTDDFKYVLANLFRANKKEFVEFSLYGNSLEILDCFPRIDASLQYDIEGRDNVKLNILDSQFRIHNIIEDYNDLKEFHYVAFAEDEEYCKSDWSKMLQSFSHSRFPIISYLCKKDSKTVGVCIGHNIVSQNKMYIYSIAVLPEFRRYHLGEHLIRLFLNTEPAIHCYLDVLESAIPARKLYEKTGFVKTRIVSAICRRKDL